MSSESAGPRLRAEFLRIVDNQLRDNDPPAVRATLERLVKEGYSQSEARRLIAGAMAVEIYEMLKYQRPYNQERYVENPNRLPQLPGDD
jgi:hypothetical protein